MVAIRNILFFVSASAAVVIPRDASTIEKDISTIDSNVKSLTNAVNNYNGGGAINAIPIANAESTLDKSIQQGTKDANATSTLSSADSKAISNAIQSLIPDIEASLKALKSKKADFQADNLESTVENDLKSLKSDTDDFANRLIQIASSDVKSQANKEKTRIDNDFNVCEHFLFTFFLAASLPCSLLERPKHNTRKSAKLTDPLPGRYYRLFQLR